MPSRSLHTLICLAAVLSLGGCAHRVLRLESGILEGDARWSGRVEIRGVLLVDREAHLTIEPGTEVIFLHVDEDGDGIGDGELNVLGRLTALGAPDRPIVFRSDRPGRKGWTYLHLSGNRESSISNCVFRDAFTGIQLHYVEADVSNCLFTGNHEGLRYSTIRGEILHNTFRDNTVGIRFEGRQSRVLVEGNSFEGNGIAVFPVTRGSGEDRFRRNNFSSRDYNVKLGFDQREDLDFSDNWWGTASRDGVYGSIFDGRSDSSLGRVGVEPFLTAPVPGAGPQVPILYEAPPAGE